MLTKRAVAVLAVAAAAIAGGSGAASAAASPVQVHSSAEHFRIVSTQVASRRLSVIATGTFTAGGYETPRHGEDVIVFPGGTLTLKLSENSGSGSASSTCLFTQTGRGRFTIGHGTGRYAGITGSGKARTSSIAVTARNAAGKCIHLNHPVAYQAMITANGSISR
jgi:hypothetical protein